MVLVVVFTENLGGVFIFSYVLLDFGFVRVRGVLHFLPFFKNRINNSYIYEYVTEISIKFENRHKDFKRRSNHQITSQPLRPSNQVGSMY